MINLSNEQVEKALLGASTTTKEILEEGILDEEIIFVLKKYSLSFDLLGKVVDLAQSMLIGLLSPTQFISELKEAGIAEQAANTILKHLNETILKPVYEVQHKEQKGAVVETATTQPETAPNPTVMVQTTSSKLPTLPQTVALTNAPNAASVPAPQAVQTHQAPIRTMKHDVEGIKEQKPSLPFFSNPLPNLTPNKATITPAKNQAPGSLPSINKPPTPPSPPQSIKPPQPPKPTSMNPTHEEVSSSLQQYGIDPYREPIE